MKPTPALVMMTLSGQSVDWCEHYNIMWCMCSTMANSDDWKTIWRLWISVNSSATGKFEWNIIYVIFKHILVIDCWVISCEIALIWMSLDFTDDQSTSVQVMAWCRQATSHYLSQCWLSPLSITASLDHNELNNVRTLEAAQENLRCAHRLVNTLRPTQNGCHFADDIFNYFFLKKKFCILIHISLVCF